MNSACWRKSLKTTPRVCLQCRQLPWFLVANLQMFYFCRRSLSRDFIDHVPNPFNGCSTIYRWNKIFAMTDVLQFLLFFSLGPGWLCTPGYFHSILFLRFSRVTDVVNSMTIHGIEDSIIVAYSWRMCLSQRGYCCHTAQSTLRVRLLNLYWLDGTTICCSSR